MDRRALVTATLLMAALISALPSAAAEVEDEVKVLLLPDSFGVLPDGSGVGTDALMTALMAAGYSVTVGPLEYTWDGTNPSTYGIDVIVHLNGATPGWVPPMAGQQALVDFVRSGGGYVGGQWNGFEADEGLLLYMNDLVLQLWSVFEGCFPGSEMVWSIVPGEVGHPVLDGIPDSFTFDADAHNAAPVVEFSESPSVVLMTSPDDGPAVTVREFEEGGRIVSFSVAANYSTNLTLQDPNIQQLYVNAVSWAAPLESAPTIDDLVAAVIELRDSGKISKGQANGLINKLEAVSRQIDRANFKAAQNQMRVFVKRLEAWIESGILTQGEGGPLVEKALAIIARLPG